MRRVWVATKRARGACTPLVIAALVLAAGSGTFARGQQPSRPNVLLIVTDDQQIDYGYGSLPKTMQLFRAGGTHFNNAVTTTPLCCPARASIFSGRYAHNHGLINNGATAVQSWNAQRADETLQFDLRANGYKTAIAGKYLNTWRQQPPFFDRWAITQQLNFYNTEFNVNGTFVKAPGYSTHFIADKAIEFVTAFEQMDDAAPWFMQVSPQAPHTPATPEDRYATASVSPWRNNPANTETDLSDKPAWVRGDQSAREPIKGTRTRMQRSLLSVDDLVARLFAALQSMGEADNTLAFFLSDNGFKLAEHGLFGKRSPYDQSVMIPLFVRWPGRVAAGARDESIVANIDVAPTIYALTGVPSGHPLDGRNLFTSQRTEMYLEYQDGYRRLADAEVTPPRWHALWAPRDVYIRYRDTGEREWYSPADQWQIANAYRDGVSGNEPPNQAARDARLSAYSTCAGTTCP